MNQQQREVDGEEKDFIYRLAVERIAHSARSHLSVFHSILDDKSSDSVLDGEEVADSKTSLAQLEKLANILGELGRHESDRSENGSSVGDIVSRVVLQSQKERIACQVLGQVGSKCAAWVEGALLNLARYCGATGSLSSGGVIIELSETERLIQLYRMDTQCAVEKGLGQKTVGIAQYLREDQRVDALWIVAAFNACLDSEGRTGVVIYGSGHVGLWY
mgnify:CR=1 FL=1